MNDTRPNLAHAQDRHEPVGEQRRLRASRSAHTVTRFDFGMAK